MYFGIGKKSPEENPIQFDWSHSICECKSWECETRGDLCLDVTLEPNIIFRAVWGGSVPHQLQMLINFEHLVPDFAELDKIGQRECTAVCQSAHALLVPCSAGGCSYTATLMAFQNAQVW